MQNKWVDLPAVYTALLTIASTLGCPTRCIRYNLGHWQTEVLDSPEYISWAVGSQSWVLVDLNIQNVCILRFDLLSASFREAWQRFLTVCARPESGKLRRRTFRAILALHGETSDQWTSDARLDHMFAVEEDTGDAFLRDALNVSSLPVVPVPATDEQPSEAAADEAADD